jgi:hypothetical protein
MTEIIWKTSVPSTAFLEGVKFTKLLGRECSLEYFYEGEEDNSVVFEKLIFEGVESFKCTYFRSCSLEMIDAYDKVIDVGNSDWLSEIKSNLANAEADSENLKHLRIYFDDGLCYEFICSSFEVVKERKGNYPVNPVHPVWI